MATHACVYRHFSTRGELLYVGKSNAPERRYREHSGEIPGKPKAEWFDHSDPELYTETWYDSDERAFEAEDLAIFFERPQYNVTRKYPVVGAITINGGWLRSMANSGLTGMYGHREKGEFMASHQFILAKSLNGTKYVAVMYSAMTGSPSTREIVDVSDNDIHLHYNILDWYECFEAASSGQPSTNTNILRLSKPKMPLPDVLVNVNVALDVDALGEDSESELSGGRTLSDLGNGRN